MGAPVPHESARGHVTGAALYTDDLVSRFPGILHAWPVMAPHAHARVAHIDVLAATRATGVVAVLTQADVPGEGNTGASRHDEPIFPTEVLFHGQPVAWALAETLEAARLGANLVQVQYEPLRAILTIQEAIASDSFLTDELRLTEGSPTEILDRGLSPSGDALIDVEGELAIGGQEHFYLETQASIAWLDESGGVAVHSSTQHPSETQDVVARVLGIARHEVTVECLRMGGAFGGKEVQANPYAAVAALGAWKTRRPVCVRLTRGLDIALTGKRHPYLARYRAGFSADGRIQALQLRLYSDGGWSLDLSEPVMFRSLFHCDNAYRLPHVEAIGRVCRTNKTSQTAFRGFGGPQAMVVIEEIMSRAAHRLAIPSHVIRERNFYRDGDHTHYGQTVSDASRIGRIWTELKQSSDFDARRDEVDRFNASHSHVRRGLAITPVKFGISFTATFYNQAGALVLVYRDGSVQVNHGGTEMGQGLHTKIQQIAADALGLPLAAVRVMSTRTDKVPNTSATAASAGTDLNGAAVADACVTIRERLVAVAAQLLECDAAEVAVANGVVRCGSQDGGTTLSFAALCEASYLRRVPLFAQGFYRTPEIHFDRATGRGKPFHYFAFGAAVSEVEVDRFTGAYRLRRTDILHDVGNSLSLNVDRGQVEGGFIQGVGWLTLEELIWDAQGRVATAGASTYKLPSWSEVPEVFNVSFLERAAQPSVIGSSKAVGEPPLMLAISVREALRNAIEAFGNGAEAVFDSPATPERVFFATEAVRATALART
jgi:xanthine dehydrogenase large subunit